MVDCLFIVLCNQYQKGGRKRKVVKAPGCNA